MWNLPPRRSFFYEVSLNASLIFNHKSNTTSSEIYGRHLLHVLLCPIKAIEYLFRDVQSVDLREGTVVPQYCALKNQTLKDICTSFPMKSIDQIQDRKYQASIDVESELDTLLSQHESIYYVIVDACETLGGEEAVLRSCLNQPDAFYDDQAAPCVQCTNVPREMSSCVVPPFLFVESLVLDGKFKLSDDKGEEYFCITEKEPISKVRIVALCFYMGYALLWCIALVGYVLHILRYRRWIIPQLHQEIVRILFTQCVYALSQGIIAYLEISRIFFFSSSSSFSSDFHFPDGVDLSSTSLSVAKILMAIAFLSDLWSQKIGIELLCKFTKGYQITREELRVEELRIIRSLGFLWSILQVFVKHTSVIIIPEDILLFIWAVAWFVLVLQLGYSLRGSLQILQHQLTYARTLLALDPTTTPLHTKYQLFQKLKWICGGYTLGMVIVYTLESVYLSRTEEWLLWNMKIAQEIVSLGLYFAMGYLFRCRGFVYTYQSIISSDPVGAKASISHNIVIQNPDKEHQLGRIISSPK
jgi:hypothetical protein